MEELSQFILDAIRLACFAFVFSLFLPTQLALFMGFVACVIYDVLRYLIKHFDSVIVAFAVIGYGLLKIFHWMYSFGYVQTYFIIKGRVPTEEELVKMGTIPELEKTFRFFIRTTARRNIVDYKVYAFANIVITVVITTIVTLQIFPLR